MSEEYEEYPDEYLDENGNPCEAEPEQKRGELKPCPFCGGMPKVNDWTLKGITDKRCFCDNEKCPVYLSKTIAIDDWNTRPIEDALNARIAELEAENNRLAELLLNELSQVEIATDLGNKRWTALNKIYQYGEKHNTNWCKRIAQEGLGIKNA